MEAIAPIDQQAKDIITQVRRNFPTGKVSSPEDLPAPPKELESLQQQKDSVVLQFRAELQNRLGNEKFDQFDQFARQKVTPQITGLAKQEAK